MAIGADHFELVIRTVRGFSPIPEYQNVQIDRTELAKAHIETLKREKGNMLLSLAFKASSQLLTKIWNRVSPAALTMCGEKSVGQLVNALYIIHKEEIPGDFIEAGVWRGGLPIIMRAFLAHVDDTERMVWLADSFQGLPKPEHDRKDKLAHLLLSPLQHLSASRTEVEQAFDFFDLLDAQVGFLEGWFRETLPSMPDRPLALIRLDGDYYESTRDALEALYDRLSFGGFLIVDDYHLPLGCKKAVNEFRKKRGIDEKLVRINNQAVYWRKERT